MVNRYYQKQKEKVKWQKKAWERYQNFTEEPKEKKLSVLSWM